MNNNAYHGNQHLKKTDVLIEFTRENIKEFGKCSRSPIYFIETYVKIVNVDQGLVNFKPYEYQKEIIETSVNNRFVICKLPRQSGKALPLDTPILTPSGFRQLGELKENDLIYGPDGKETRITFITETMYDHEIYELVFDNGDIVRADKDHVWEVNSTNWTAGSRNLTTEQLKSYLAHSNKPYINFTLPLQSSTKKLPIDPYQLGMWIGDGATNGATITCCKDDLSFYQTKIDIGHVWYDSRNSNVAYFTLPAGQKAIREANLLGNKHIPSEYLLASFDQKLELLRGLMDTDGSVVNGSGSCEFYQKNENIVNQVRTLLASMGIKSRKRYRIINDINYWTVSFTTTHCVFALPRKAAKQRCLDHPKNNRLYIKQINRVDSEPVRCLQVDNDSHLFLCGETLIPTHNTTSIVGLMLWYILFNEDYSIAILAHKLTQAQEIMSRIQLAYENLPKWLQQGIVEWNKRNIELENGSKIIASSTTSSGARGGSYSLLYLDEFAFVPNNMQEKFFSSTYPVNSSGQTTKVLITSTPNGLNLFYKLWRDSELGRNDYKRISILWSDTPGRNQKWKEETIRNTSVEQFRVEFETEFVGSSSTLIHPDVLRSLVYEQPIKIQNSTKIYEEPKKNHVYFTTVDTARGLGNDYSVITIFDCTQVPYKVVAIYRSNDISPLLLPAIIQSNSENYNSSYVLIETNDIGQQVADILHYDLEYENMLRISTDDRSGVQVLSGGFGQVTKLGLRTTKQTKRFGCSNLKSLVENQKLILNDDTIIYELMRFVAINNSYQAEDGNDDTVMCCVLFAWMTQQQYFKDLTNIDVRKLLQQEKQPEIDEEVVSFLVSTEDDIDSSVVLSVNNDKWLMFPS